MDWPFSSFHRRAEQDIYSDYWGLENRGLCYSRQDKETRQAKSILVVELLGYAITNPTVIFFL
jgi:hypothetical protein